MSQRNITIYEIIERAKLIHGNKYGYLKAIWKSYRDKIIITCPIHGDFEQSVSNHLSGYGCAKCKFDYLISLRKMTTKEFIRRAKLIHGNKYDYSKVIYIDNLTPVIIICKTHGEFLVTPNSHLQGRNCIKCKYEVLGDLLRIPFNELIERFNKVHFSKYSYDKAIYINMHTDIIITCPIHGDFKQRPVNHVNGSGCPLCNSSRGEHLISSILNKYNIKFIREYKIPNQKYKFRYDFYLPDYNLLIEFHGIQHFQYVPFFHNNNKDEFSDQKLADVIKKDIAKCLNINFLEFNYKQLLHLEADEFEQLVQKKLAQFINI